MKLLKRIRRAVRAFKQPFSTGFYIRLCGESNGGPGVLFGPVSGLEASITDKLIHLRAVDGKLSVLVVILSGRLRGYIYYGGSYYQGWKMVSAADFQSFKTSKNNKSHS